VERRALGSSFYKLNYFLIFSWWREELWVPPSINYITFLFSPGGEKSSGFLLL